MRKKFLIHSFFIALLATVFITLPSLAAPSAANINGYILIQTEKNGEAWYVYPRNGQRYFLGRPAQAFEIMKKLSLGAKHDFIVNRELFPASLAGLILLDIETNGQAYYIYPKNLKKYYLGLPADAFKVMKSLGLGITNQNLAAIPQGDINGNSLNIPTGHYLIANVPFTSQAPAGDWADPRQQNGCEEAASLIAISWARQENFTQSEALKQITSLSDWEQKKYGEFRDTSAQDTLERIIKNYFGYQNAEFKPDATMADMVDELHQGHILIAPMNGQIMGNPHFTAPGPATHMVVIIGYDSGQRIFITNDPGTRLGKNYKYDLDVFYNAMRDYPTGNHKPIEQIHKDIIIVR